MQATIRPDTPFSSVIDHIRRCGRHLLDGLGLLTLLGVLYGALLVLAAVP